MSAGKITATILLYFMIPFDMQHDHVLRKLNFDLLTSSPGWGYGDLWEIYLLPC